MRSRPPSLLLFPLLIAAGCSGEATKTPATSASPQPDLPGGATPAGAYAKVRAALTQDEARDPWRRVALLFPHVTEAARVRLLGSLYHEAAFASMTAFEPDPKKLETLNAIYAEHQVPTDTLPDEDPAAAVARRFGAVKDKPALMRTLLAFLAQHGERLRKQAAAKPDASAVEVWGPELTDVLVEGEQATAVAEVRKGAAARRQPLAFKKEQGRWRVDWR